MSISPPPIETGDGTRLMADRAYSELRDRLLTLKIAPGSPINEDALIRELQMGRTPLREAIRRLALENLVVVFPRRGTFATEIHLTDLRHISEVRTVLERLAARLATERLSPARRPELQDILSQLEASRSNLDREELIALDARVHRFIYSCTANPYLEETLGRYFNLSLRIWHLAVERLPHLVERVHEHSDLLRAIDEGDAERAEELLTQHIDTFEREIRSVL